GARPLRAQRPAHVRCAHFAARGQRGDVAAVTTAYVRVSHPGAAARRGKLRPAGCRMVDGRSAAVDEGRASKTALGAAARRAIHQLADDDPKVFSDPIAVRLVEAAAPGTITSYLATVSRPELKSSRAGFVLRSRFAEDELATAAAAGVRQYVLLG